MIDDLEFEELEDRLERLETTVNKSNFSVGLALSLDNVREDLRTSMKTLTEDDKGEPYATNIIELTMFIIEHALIKEADSLRQKGKD